MYSTADVYDEMDESTDPIEEIVDKNKTDISLDPKIKEFKYRIFSDDKISFRYHQINDDEIDKIKRAFNYSSEEGKEKGNVIWNEKNKDDLIRSTKVVNDVNFVNQEVPESKDLSKTPYFPEIKGQGLQGSCAAWAITYYAYGFLEAKDNNWTGASEGNPKHLMSPSWTFNKIHCEGSGSSIKENAEIINNWGVSTWSNLTYNQNDDVSWGNESAFRDAVKHRGKELYYLEYNEFTTIDELKGLINSEIPITFSIDSNQFSDAFSDDNAIISSKEYKREYPDHSNTIVGYDDSVSDDGEKGAFKVANSYGKSFGEDGFYWITYDMLNEMGILSNLQYITDRVDYEPSLVGTFKFDERPTRTGNISLSIISDRGVKRTKQFDYEFDPNFEHTLPSFMCFDLSEFSDRWDGGKRADTFELDIGSHFGEIRSFKIEYYENKYRASDPDYISEQSEDVPLPTPSQVKVNFYGPSHIVTTEPEFKSQQVPYARTVSVTFTETMDTDTIPKLEQIKGKDPGGWNFEGWVSVNTENDTATWSHNPWEVNQNITLKVSGYVNGTGYEGETYQWWFKTKPYEPINIGSHSDFVEYANDFGWAGDGSESNPWMIEYIEIDGKDHSSCVFISDVKDHFIIRNSTFHNSTVGLDLISVSNGVIKNNTFNDVGDGIKVKNSNNIAILNNVINTDRRPGRTTGIFVSKSFDNEFVGNLIKNKLFESTSTIGINLNHSKNNLIKNNIISHYYTSIRAFRSEDCKINSNTIKNETNGINLLHSTNLDITNNSFTNSGIDFSNKIRFDVPVKYFSSHDIKSNFIDDKPILYYNNKSNVEIKENVGELILVSCRNFTIQDLDFKSKPGILIHSSENISIIKCEFSFEYINGENPAYNGINIDSSENISVTGCEFNQGSLLFAEVIGSSFSNNVFKDIIQDYKFHEIMITGGIIGYQGKNIIIKENEIMGKYNGMYFKNMSECKITQNTISYSEKGMFLFNVSYSYIYHNNFYENEYPAEANGYTEMWVEYYDWLDRTWPITNTWDDGYPSGGNYWSQFDKKDIDDDGIIDSPYYIPTNMEKDDNMDRFPLAEPFKPWDPVDYPKQIKSVKPTPNSYNVSLDEDIKIVFKGSLDTSDIPSIELIGNNKSSNIVFQGFSSTNIENDTVVWTHDNWVKGEKITYRISSYSFINKSSNNSYEFSFTTYEEQPPNITDLSSETIKNDEKYTFLAEIDDNAAVENAEVIYWIDGNKSKSMLYNVYKNRYKFKIKVPVNAAEFRYKFKAVDTSGNIVNTQIKNYTIIDDISPTIKMKEIEEIQVFENTTFDASESFDNRGIKNFYWDIDGKKFNKSRVNVTFNKLGNIKVSLAVVDYSGNWDSVIKIYTVSDDIKPVANGGGNRTVPINEEVKLDASNSTDNYGISEYIWKFDNKIFLGKTINYTFTKLGTFNINLKVKDIDGNTDSVNFVYTVKDLEPPVADAGNNITAIVDRTVTLDGSSSTDNYYIKDYLWEIQGNVYKGKKFDYTFDEPGNYQVTLKVVDLSQNSNTDSIEVTIKPGEVTVGPIKDQDENRLKGVKVELIHGEDTVGTNKTDKDGMTRFKVDIDLEGEEFKIKLKDNRFDGTKERSFEGNVSGEISVKTENNYVLPIVIASIASVVLIILWVYRKKFNSF